MFSLKPQRRGVASAEFAVCLPIIVFLVVGSIEACGMIYLKQAVTIAAYEGARTANAIGATTSDVQATCNQVLSDRGITGATTVTSPTEVADTTSGAYFEVRCSAPCAENSLLPLWMFQGSGPIEGRAEFMKKY